LDVSGVRGLLLGASGAGAAQLRALMCTIPARARGELNAYVVLEEAETSTFAYSRMYQVSRVHAYWIWHANAGSKVDLTLVRAAPQDNEQDEYTVHLVRGAPGSSKPRFI